ncbi:inner membrane protein [Mariprofundus aestuarium]|uniref:Inner membrane protein n=1 Tax=Mariprofundus aestuarium TaxID=1921086 RepID=A0A2K8KVN7_MARES|nr:metal-dependent hydrolase [Mariprofundus aestuarium]ATX78823.1 inner membrane protein [Mariprofundus aestuarium]
MDPITHAISGAALARAIPKHHLPPLQLLFLILLTMAPDADIILRFFSETVYLQHHRGLTHSILLIPLWGWLVYSLSSRRIKANPIMPWLLGGALLLHILLDLITTFGTMIIAPFSDWRASLDLLFIIDPFFTASLLIPLLLGLIWKQHKRKMGVVSLVLMCSYLGLTYSNQQQAIDLARNAQPDAVSYNALPMAFSPFHWQLIAIYPDHFARAAVNLRPGFTGTRLLFDEEFANGLISTEMSGQDDIFWQELPRMQTVEGWGLLPGTAFYAWFARYPVLLDRSENHIDFGDLAFGSGAPGVRPAFQLHIDLTGSADGNGSTMAAHAAENRQPRAWLIWRGERRSEMTLTSAPFSWLSELTKKML